MAIEHRRQGHARRMVDFALKNFKDEGVVWVSLWTGWEMEEEGLQNMYRKFWFTEGTYQKDYYTDGVGTRLFVKRLN